MSAFGGDDVDTLALMFDKLQYIFRGYDPYIQTFTEMLQAYKEGRVSEREYYAAMIDAVFKYSALEFLGLKAMFEIKKALNRMNNPSRSRQSVPSTISGNAIGQPVSGPQNSIVSFISAKSLPGRDEITKAVASTDKKCVSCGKTLSDTAKFCTSCGNKV
ncbi:MAG: zinc ribbon domain-containing protein [Thaumarchaeota archaeon]|nr:zinc ribbon domain-containing protein [Nitrososphaerota archaeon]